MISLVQIIIAIAAVAFFLWMLLTSKNESHSDAVIDPNDARQIGTLIGLMGGSIADAAVAQAALRRFEQEHGRKATMKDAGTVAGLMRSCL